MRRSFAFVVNRNSGTGPKDVIAITRLLREAHCAVEVTYSTGIKATRTVVSEAVKRGDIVVSVGGDGTLSSVAGDVARLGGTLGIVPAGRGNDFARMASLPSEPERIAQTLLQAAPTPTDLISARLPNGPTRMLASSIYAGVDAQAGLLVNRSRWLPRKLQYPSAALRSLATFRPATYYVTIDGEEYSFQAATVVVANSGYYGSGMNIAPEASIDDSFLDVVVVEAVGRLDMMRAFPRVYSGKHVQLDEVHTFRSRSVTVSAQPGRPLGGDGEPLGTLGHTPINIDVSPGALQVLR